MLLQANETTTAFCYFGQQSAGETNPQRSAPPLQLECRAMVLADLVAAPGAAGAAQVPQDGARTKLTATTTTTPTARVGTTRRQPT